MQAVTEAMKRLKERGFDSPYLRPFVVARINPLRFKRGGNPDVDETLDTMLAAARRFDAGRVRADQVAPRQGGAHRGFGVVLRCPAAPLPRCPAAPLPSPLPRLLPILASYPEETENMLRPYYSTHNGLHLHSPDPGARRLQWPSQYGQASPIR